jgi:hypothetical protein
MRAERIISFTKQAAVVPALLLVVSASPGHLPVPAVFSLVKVFV